MDRKFQHQAHLVFANGSPTVDAAGSSFCGFVDRLDDAVIEGWAADLSDLSDSLELELMVEGIVVTRCKADRERLDLVPILGRETRSGFFFDTSVFRVLKRLHRSIPSGRVYVRSAKDGLVLPSQLGPPTLDSLFDEHYDSAGSRNVREYAADLMAQLSRKRAAVSLNLQRPYRPSPTNSVGFIEIAMIDNDWLWIAGWMNYTDQVEQSAVIVDGRKTTAALAHFYFDRNDIPSNARGFIGILVADWRPSPERSAYLFLGEEHQSQLEVLRPLPILSGQAFGEYVNERLSSASGANVRLLKQILTGVDSWSIRGASGFAASATLDRVIVLPPFGALIEGWVLSPSKRYSSFVLRFGGSVLACDPGSLQRKSRKDLLEAVRGVASLVDEAGFVAACNGLLPVSEIDNAVLKVIYEDGTTSNHAIDPAVIVRLSPVATVEAAEALFPALPYELFFPEFSRALIQELEPLTRSWAVHSVVPTQRVIAIVVPQNISDAFFLFARLAFWLQAENAATGVVLLAENGKTRALVTRLFGELICGIPKSMSLVFLEDCDYALYVLPAILLTLGAEVFAYFGRQTMPTETGWQAAKEAVEAGDLNGPILLQTFDPVAPSTVVGGKCFAWNRWSFAVWVASQPLVLGGAPEALADLNWQVPAVPAAACLVSSVITPRIVAAVNMAASG